MGGHFTTIAGQARNHIARINPDGTLDSTFNPSADGVVDAIAVQSDGKVLIGGSFRNINGQPRNLIARLDPTTGAPDSFNPTPNGDIQTVYSIGIQNDGKILVVGGFTSIGGQARNNVARLDPNTGMADSFDPNVDGSVYAIAVQADGNILLSGAFTSIGGQTRNRIGRVNGTTGAPDSFDPNANNYVGSIAIQADGKILVGGNFDNIGGQSRGRIARLNSVTGAADSFAPALNAISVDAIVIQTDGNILIGGWFWSIDGQTRANLARLSSTTGLADSFNPNANGNVTSVALQPDGKILVGGWFNTIWRNDGGSVTRNRIARLEIDGSVDQTINLNIVGTQVTLTAVQPDGKTLISGEFSSVLGLPRNNLARLNTDGTLDLGFDPNPNGYVGSIVAQGDGKILVGGSFTNIGGQTRNRIARLEMATGSADSFDPNANSYVNAIAVQPDGKILVGGLFHGASSIGGQARNYIARLDPLTGLADLFDPNANNRILSIGLPSDGRVLIGGDFTTVSGQIRSHIARLDGTTGLADSFDPSAQPNSVGYVVGPLILQANGGILVAGYFDNIGGQVRPAIARLDPTTGLADLFNPAARGPVFSIAAQADGKVLAGGLFWGSIAIGGQNRSYVARLDGTSGLPDSLRPTPDNEVESVTLQPDGKIWVGGLFASVGGQPRTYLARLSNDTAALRELAVSQTTVTWTCLGSTPDFSRVTFDLSLDNTNYVRLGDASNSHSQWILSGLDLPTEQNIYVRARGYYRSGLFASSESILESVQIAFLPAQPTATPTPVSVSGTIFYCSNPAPGVVPNVTLTLTGAPSDSTLSMSSGNYQLNVGSSGAFVVTPYKAPLPISTSQINTVDVIAVQRDHLGNTLTGCRAMAADVTIDGLVNTNDVIAIQRSFLGQTSGIGHVGIYKFIPTSRTYSHVGTDLIGQDYDALVLGDVVSPFVP